MAQIHGEDFGDYGNEEDLLLSGVYAQANEVLGNQDIRVSLVADPDGVSPGRVLRMDNANASGPKLLRKVIASGGQSKVGVGLRVWCPELPYQGAVAPIAFLSASGITRLFTLTIGSTGTLRVHQGDEFDPILYTSNGPVITAQGWHHLEMAVEIDASDGSIEVRWEGIPVPGLVQTGINTGSTEIAQIAAIQRAEGTGYGHDYYIKDWFGWDDTGTYFNDFQGTIIPHRHELTADIAQPWGIVGGTDAYTILNGSPPDPDAYIYADDSPPDPYVASISALPPDITSVRSVMIRYMAAKNDGGDATVQPGMIGDPDGTPATWTGTARPITVAQTFWDDFNYVDPTTTDPWTPIGLNGAHVQLDRTV